MGGQGPEPCWATAALSARRGPSPTPLLTLQDAAYHCTAALFYLSASVLEALATIQMHNGFTYKQYHENISAVVSPTHVLTAPASLTVLAEGCPVPPRSLFS